VPGSISWGWRQQRMEGDVWRCPVACICENHQRPTSFREDIMAKGSMSYSQTGIFLLSTTQSHRQVSTRFFPLLAKALSSQKWIIRSGLGIWQPIRHDSGFQNNGFRGLWQLKKGKFYGLFLCWPGLSVLLGSWGSKCLSWSPQRGGTPPPQLCQHCRGKKLPCAFS
jgi:hypothetical protein